MIEQSFKKLKDMRLGWVTITALLISAGGCHSVTKDKKAAMQMDTAGSAHPSGVYFTCPMHRQIRSDTPGKCPICGMDLIPVRNNTYGSAGDTTGVVNISAHQQFLANIRTDTVRRQSLSGQLILTGVTMFDPTQTRVVSSWVSGWIQKMYVGSPGERVHRGEKLYDVYSPELSSAEKDFQMALRQKGAFGKAAVDLSVTIDVLKEKLVKWGLSDQQIRQLEYSSDTPDTISIYSRYSGYIVRKRKEAGDHVSEGDVVLSLVNNNTMWVQVQIDDSELSFSEGDPEIGVHLDGLPGRRLPGRLVFNNPVNEVDSRVHLLNIAIGNPDGRIQPGMLAYVYLHASRGQPVVAVPKSAVIYDEDKDYVWIKRPGGGAGSAAGSFERRTVKLGTDNATFVAVLHGIKAGEQVVSSGAYLLNSEYILRYGSGANLSGMQMSDMMMKGRSH
jgi:Cu(I)/Ag(I) efflux system membrane fusion protein